MAQKTNAARILDTLHIDYELREYTISESDLSAEHAAESIGIDPSIIFKTLVLIGNTNDIIVALVPGNAHLDLKRIAKVSGQKNCQMLPLKDLERITGYIRGGCSPIGMKKQFPTFLDSAALEKGQIIISAGKRGSQLLLGAEDLIKAANATVAPITKDE